MYIDTYIYIYRDYNAYIYTYSYHLLNHSFKSQWMNAPPTHFLHHSRGTKRVLASTDFWKTLIRLSGAVEWKSWLTLLKSNVDIYVYIYVPPQKKKNIYIYVFQRYPSPRMADPKKVRVLDTFHIFQQPELKMLGGSSLTKRDWVRSYYTSVIFPEIYIYVFRCISDYTTHLMHDMFIIYLDAKTYSLGWRCNDQCPNPLTHNSYSLPRFCSFLAPDAKGIS